MRPSFSVTLEPGLERGVPWGRDLYTFVTSAAGHMMRTLQKPRKNRPSKRQVNHRRFLHNMIQRKFADIEAANHRLASALYFKEQEKNVSAGTPEQSSSPSEGGCLHDPDKGSVHTDADGVSKSWSDVSVGSYETEISEKKQPDSGHLWKRHPKSRSTTFTSRKNNHSKGTQRQKKGSGNQKLSEFTFMSSPKGLDYYHGEELFRADYYENETLLQPTSSLPEDTQTTLNDSSFIQNMDISPSFSPELSPLSLDSCDFSIQMFTDISTCTQAQKSIADIAESQWTDIMDLFSVGSKDVAGCMDVEAYFESICACPGDTGADEDAFADQSGSFTDRIFSNRAEVEDPHCERGEYRYEYGYSCHGDQGLIINHFQSDQRSSQVLRQCQDAAETQFNNFTPSQGTDTVQNQVPTSISYLYNVSEPIHPQEESPCMLVNCENNLNFMSFEGVAQSFSAPLHNPEHHLIPTPPHEEDWLFTDILNDRKSLHC
eukprot:superscaffoldBa00004486_g18956